MLKPMQRYRVSMTVVAALALCGGLGTAACDSAANNATTPTSRSAAPEANCPPAPTVAMLDAMAGKALDPTTPAADLLKMVQGMDSVNPEPIDQALQQVRRQSPQLQFTKQITDVDAHCGSASARGTISVNGHHPMEVLVPFVYDKGYWKIGKAYFCGLLAQAAEQAPPEYQGQIEANQDRLKQLTGC
jgi:hypothetical protein